jgi:hypothetical protein
MQRSKSSFMPSGDAATSIALAFALHADAITRGGFELRAIDLIRGGAVAGAAETNTSAKRRRHG